MAEGQILVHVQWVANSLITVPENLYPTVQSAGPNCV